MGARARRVVAQAVAGLKDRVPADVEVRVVYSRGEAVSRASTGVKSTILSRPGLLAVLMVFLFLPLVGAAR